MEKLVVSKRDKEVQDANRKVHDFGAENFEFYPPYVKKQLRKMYCDDARYIRTLFGRKPAMLDCGCGTGWLSEEFAKVGYTIDINDISPEMVKLTKRRLGRKVRNATTEDATELLYGLAKKGVKYDVISFSAMLHHIYDYLRVLHYAAQCLNPGGVIYISGEPQLRKNPSLGQRFSISLGAHAINLYKAIRRPVYAAKFIRAKFISKDEQSGDIHLAEFHASCGIDETGVQRKLHEEGMRVIKYETYAGQPFLILKPLDWLIKKDDPRSFRLVAMKIQQ